MSIPAATVFIGRNTPQDLQSARPQSAGTALTVSAKAAEELVHGTVAWRIGFEPPSKQEFEYGWIDTLSDMWWLTRRYGSLDSQRLR